MARHLLAIDQGTTGSTALVLSADGKTVGRANKEFRQHYPEPGWVEHEPAEIWQSVVDSVGEALRAAGVPGDDIAAVGITNQRETTLLWDRKSGRPVHRAIVWQDRRTADQCAQLKAAGHEPEVRRLTGLVLDPYFSGTKLRWLLDNVPGARDRAERGELAFGTVDSFLVWELSGGATGAAPHVTDVTNASRTLLMNLRTQDWDDRLRSLLGIPRSLLPRIVPNAGPIGTVRGFPGLPEGLPITGMAGDQQAALFGQACFSQGDVKCTYGTGAFVVLNTGDKPVESRYGLLSTIAWRIGDRTTYALEGSSFIAGAAVQWLRDGLGLIRTAAEVESLAKQVSSSDGVVFVPALVGLGAPHWDPEARGAIVGLTRGTTAAHLARATLEAIAHQVAELIAAMRDDLDAPITRLRVDGGAAANDVLMEFQCDVSNLTVERPFDLESTARGAALLAGIGAGMFATSDAARIVKIERAFTPKMSEPERARRLSLWQDAVRRTKGRLGG